MRTRYRERGSSRALFSSRYCMMYRIHPALTCIVSIRHSLHTKTWTTLHDSTKQEGQDDDSFFGDRNALPHNSYCSRAVAPSISYFKARRIPLYRYTSKQSQAQKGTKAMPAHKRIVSFFLFLLANVNAKSFTVVAGLFPISDSSPDAVPAMGDGDDDPSTLLGKYKHEISNAVTGLKEKTSHHGDDTASSTHQFEHPRQQQQLQQQSHTIHERHLQQVQDISRLFSDFLDTPIDQWSGAQWVILIIVVIIVSALCRCLCSCCRPPYYYRSSYPPPVGYYYGGYGRGGSTCCSCSDIFWCLCCFEWCCRDCQDVDACCNNTANVYQGGQMV